MISKLVTSTRNISNPIYHGAILGPGTILSEFLMNIMGITQGLIAMSVDCQRRLARGSIRRGYSGIVLALSAFTSRVDVIHADRLVWVLCGTQ